jgi:hypothetical protein
VKEKKVSTVTTSRLCLNLTTLTFSGPVYDDAGCDGKLLL